MVHVVYFDCQHNVTLDAMTAALLSCGLDFEVWLGLMNVASESIGFNLEIRLENSIAHNVSVEKLIFAEQSNPGHCASMLASHALDLLERCECDITVKNFSRTVFARLLESEARVRGVELAQLSLSHNLLVQTLLQIVGFTTAHKIMEIDCVYSAPLSILTGPDYRYNRDVSENFSDQTIDLLLVEAAAPLNNDATGLSSPLVASVLTTAVSKWSMPNLEALRKVGYGVSSSDENNSVCRVLIGDMQSSCYRAENITVIEANLDDLSPQVLAFASEELHSAGALDVFITATTMKKGRSGHILTVLCSPENKEKMQSIIFAQTSTLGVRSYNWERAVAERELQTVNLDDGHNIRVKVGFDLRGNIINAQPEYEDCAAYARRSGRSIREVMQLAMSKFEAESIRNILPSTMIALLLTCLLTIAVQAKSPGSFSSPTSTSARSSQFSHVLHQAHGQTLASEAGFEIYSWNVGGKWHYSLLPATREEKTFTEVTDSSVTWKSLIELEAALGKLAPCDVSWHNHVLKEDGKDEALSMPHLATLNQLKAYCKSRQIKLLL